MKIFVGIALLSFALWQGQDKDNAALQDVDEGGLTSVAEEDLRKGMATVLDFETDQDGEPLEVGSDVSTTYVDVGCEIETSIEDSFPCVQAYTVRKKGNQSCATKSPPYTGTITLRFCKPGDKSIAATVSQFGVALSFVSPEGTLVEAYDLEGDLIGRIATDVTGGDYIGFTSDTPIAQIKIVPVETVDPDYAFDDVVFDPPNVIEDE